MRTRKQERKPISLPGRYFTGLGTPVDVLLKDLSTGGCSFALETHNLALGSRLQIHVGSSGPHHAHVKWLRDGEAGVQFTAKLDDALFDNFQASHVPDSAQTTIIADFEDMQPGRPQRFC